MFTIVASDNFNRAAGGLGANWTQLGTPQLAILADTVVECPDTVANEDCMAIWNASTFKPNQWAQIELVYIWVSILYVGVFLRGSGTGPSDVSGYALQTDGTSGSTHTNLYRYNGGVKSSELASWATTLVATDTLRGDIETIDESTVRITMRKNGVAIGSPYNDTDANRILTGQAGAFGFTVNPQNHSQFDNWVAGNIDTIAARIGSPIRPAFFRPGNAR